MIAEISKDESKETLAALGIIGPWYLRHSQLDIYDLLLKCKNPFVEASRRFGKTTSTAVFVYEMLMANPNWICRWCGPDQKQVRTIVKPIFNSIMAKVPKDKRARWITTDSHYRFPNGSILYLVGVNHDKGESARGPAANIIVADEYGFWVEAEYIAKSILFPQLQNQEGQWFIKTSTPPPDLGHIYYQEKKIAQRKGRYILKTIWDNEALSEKELEEIISEAGGVESVTFRREYECEEIADPKKLIIPEFTDSCVIPDDTPRADFPVFYFAGDSGADDNTALLFACFDFTTQILTFEDEWVDNGTTTPTIARIAKEKEKELWGEVKPRRRVYDASKQIILDLQIDYKYFVDLPQKDDKISAIHVFRTDLSLGKIKIKSRCKNLIEQIRIGMWKDDRHSDFARNQGLGHLDALAAAIYLNRSVDRNYNPIPRHFGADPSTHYISSIGSSANSKTGQALKSAFLSKRGLR